MSDDLFSESFSTVSADAGDSSSENESESDAKITARAV